MRAIAISPFRATRAEEMWLLWHFAGMIWLEWRMLVEPDDTIQTVTDVASPLMAKRLKKQLAKELAEARELDALEPEPEPQALLRAKAAMLYAATNWFCRLELPKCAGDLWADPPLIKRTRALA